MAKIILPLLVIALLLGSCATPLFAPPTPTATVTAIPSSTPTFTPAPTSTPTVTLSPTATETLVPTSTLSKGAPHSRDEFVIMVKAGLIHCLGYQQSGSSQLTSFISQATAAGVIPTGSLEIGTGVPSLEDPSQCFYLITVYRGKHFIVYKDSAKNRFVKITLTD